MRISYTGSLVHDLMKAISFQTYDPKTFTRPPAKKTSSSGRSGEKNITEMTSLRHRIFSKNTDRENSQSHPLTTFRRGDFRDASTRSLEEKVYYADKRVAHTKIVPLTTRLEEGWRRYGGGKVKSEHVKNRARDIYARRGNLDGQRFYVLRKI